MGLECVLVVASHGSAFAGYSVAVVVAILIRVVLSKLFLLFLFVVDEQALFLFALFALFVVAAFGVLIRIVGF